MIDAHFHLWDASTRPHEWLREVPNLESRYSLAQYEQLAHEHGIDAGILVQVLNDADETREFLAIAADSPLVAGVVGWLDIEAPDVLEQIAELREAPGGSFLVGVRHLVEQETDPDYFSRRSVLNGLRAVAASGLVFDLMARASQLSGAFGAIEQCDDLIVVLDRAGKPNPRDLDANGWRKNVAAFAKTGRVVAKVAGLANEVGANWTRAALGPVVDELLENFGPKALLFGF